MFTQAALCVFEPKKNSEQCFYHGCDQDSLFDLASLTKLLVTAPLIAEAEISHLLDLDQALDDLKLDLPLPKQVANKSLRDLLQHESGLPAWHNFWIGQFLKGDESASDLSANRLDRVREVFERITNYRSLSPVPVYSDLGYILLAYVLERKSKQPLDLLFKNLLSKISPEYTGKIGFSKQIQGKNFVSSGFCALRKRLLCGEVHDENAAALGGVSGHAGLFGSLSALSGFYRALIASALGHHMLLQSKNAIEIGKGFGYGYHKMDSEFSRPFANGKSLGHLGFTGTGLWYDPSHDKGVLLLCNRTIYGRLNPKIKDFRREILTLVEKL